MVNLQTSDLHAAFDFLEKIGRARDLDTFAETLLSELGSVVPADVFAYNEVNPNDKRAFFIADPPESIPPNGLEILERHMHENPLVVHTARTRDGRAVKWSDFVTQRELHETALWNGLFRPSRLERQMVALLPAPAPLLVAIVLMRCGQDFAERDRTLLNLLRPHLANAYRNARVGSALAAVEAVSAERDEALVVLGGIGEPLAITPSAYRLLPAFGESTPGQLPERMIDWCRRCRAEAPLPPAPIRGVLDGRTIEARMLTTSVVLLRVEEVKGPLVEADALSSLRLAPREREVLALVAEGLSNRQIAGCLEIEPATVKKHLERIYEKLGVGTRTAAAAVAFRTAGRPDARLERLDMSEG